jgi:tetratricopeptide (TPR) repeat protein
LALADTAVTRALTLTPNNGYAHLARAMVLRNVKKPQQALLSLEKAISLNPNLSVAYIQVGSMKILLGRPAEAAGPIEKGLALDPYTCNSGLAHYYLGLAEFLLKHDDAAIAWLQRSIDGNPCLACSRYTLASAAALADRMVEARAVFDEFNRLFPGYTIKRIKDIQESDNATYLAQQGRLYEGLRELDMPEQ